MTSFNSGAQPQNRAPQSIGFLLLDNFTLDAMREAVRITAGRALLEASGGVNLEQIRKIAATGVDRISIGKLTKDVVAVDYSLRIVA